MRRLHTRLALGRPDRGFSFIELLAYMAIAALLILAAIPQFNQYREKAVVSTLESDVHNASLAAEAALINPVAERADSGVHLTASASDLDQITSAVEGVKRSATTDKPFVVASVGATGYSITASSTKTTATAVYLSQLDPTRPSYSVGVNLVDGNGNLAGASGATTQPSAGATSGTGGGAITRSAFNETCAALPNGGVNPNTYNAWPHGNGVTSTKVSGNAIDWTFGLPGNTWNGSLCILAKAGIDMDALDVKQPLTSLQIGQFGGAGNVPGDATDMMKNDLADGSYLVVSRTAATPTWGQIESGYEYSLSFHAVIPSGLSGRDLMWANSGDAVVNYDMPWIKSLVTDSEFFMHFKTAASGDAYLQTDTAG